MSINKADFINQLIPHTIRGWNEYKILPSLTIAQAILETGWGTNNLIPNNLFGIKADSSWGGKKKMVQTHEYINGKKIYIDAWFRVYDSIYESLEDRYKFLGTKRYSKVVNERDYKKACYEIRVAGYATDPQYSSKLITIIEQNKLYEIDKKAFSLLTKIQPQINTSHSNWSAEAWEWAFKTNFLDGNRPKDKVTREELALVLERMIKK